jgi:hypothetical protein
MDLEIHVDSPGAGVRFPFFPAAACLTHVILFSLIEPDSLISTGAPSFSGCADGVNERE